MASLGDLHETPMWGGGLGKAVALGGRRHIWVAFAAEIHLRTCLRLHQESFWKMSKLFTISPALYSVWLTWKQTVCDPGQCAGNTGRREPHGGLHSGARRAALAPFSMTSGTARPEDLTAGTALWSQSSRFLLFPRTYKMQVKQRK